MAGLCRADPPHRAQKRRAMGAPATALCLSSTLSQRLPLQRGRRASGRASLRPSGSVWVETQTYNLVIVAPALGSSPRMQYRYL